MFREGICSLIKEAGQDEIVADLDDAKDLHALIEEHDADVVLFDLALGKNMAFQEIKSLKQTFPDVLVIVLSMYGDVLNVERAMQAGADAYTLKRDAFDDLLFAIRASERGGRFISPAIVGGANQSINIEAPDVDSLPPRQREILSLLLDGRSNKQIAADLNVTLPTVKNTLSILFRKYNAKNRVELLAKLNLTVR